jgi:electron transfer flavoprotein beta subunit
MEIVVLVKQVPDTATRVRIAPSGLDIEREGVSYVVNPYDEFAIEEAIRQKERHGGAVTLVTLGGKDAEEALRTGLAMGADEAVRLEADGPLDGLQTARALAAFLKTMTFDLVLTGKQAVDDGLGQVGSQVAELLGLPQVTNCIALELDPAAGRGTARREVEGGVAELSVRLPLVVTAEKGLNEPRYASLPGIMKAKRKEIRVVPATEAGTAALEVRRMTLPPARAAGKIFKDLPAAEAVAALVQALHEETKLI